MGDSHTQDQASNTVASQLDASPEKIDQSYVVRERDRWAMDVTTVSPKFQVVPLPGRIELVPVAAPGSLRGFVAGPNSFDRDLDRELGHG